MKIAVRCIYTRPVTPNFLIVNLVEKEWTRFLWGNIQTRIDIVRPYLPSDCPAIKEISWIPLDNLSKQDKIIMIIDLLNN